MATKIFYLAITLRKYHLSFIAKLLDWFIRDVCGCEISSKMQVGNGTVLLHNGLGCVIHPKAIIGNNCRIHQNVTIGGRKGNALPIIGDNVMIGAGAVIIGEIRIGNNVKIGANAVVMNSVPDNCVAVGVPARIIS